MGEGDFAPISRHRRKHDPKYAQKIKEGGKRAKIIHETTVKQHKDVEVPAAEDQLTKDLEELE